MTEGGWTEVFSDGGAVRVCSGEVRRMRGLGEWMDDWVVEWVVGWIVLVERWLFGGYFLVGGRGNGCWEPINTCSLY